MREFWDFFRADRVGIGWGRRGIQISNLSFGSPRRPHSEPVQFPFKSKILVALNTFLIVLTCFIYLFLIKIFNKELNHFLRSLWIILTRGAEVLEPSHQCMVAPASKAVLLLLSIFAFFKQNYQRKAGTCSTCFDLFTAVGMDATLFPGEPPPPLLENSPPLLDLCLPSHDSQNMMWLLDADPILNELSCILIT